MRKIQYYITASKEAQSKPRCCVLAPFCQMPKGRSHPMLGSAFLLLKPDLPEQKLEVLRCLALGYVLFMRWCAGLIAHV